MKLPHPYDLIIGLDRSDKKADLCLIDIRTGQHHFAIIDTSPEAFGISGISSGSPVTKVNHGSGVRCYELRATFGPYMRFWNPFSGCKDATACD